MTFSNSKRAKKNVKRGDGRCSSHFLKVLERERERLLSKIPRDPTVEILRAKKESYSTRRGQRVGIGFVEFRQLCEVWDLSYLGFTLCLSTLLILELIEAVRGRLIGPKS